MELGNGPTGALNNNNLIVSVARNFLRAAVHARGGLQGGSHAIASIDNLRGFASNWAVKENAILAGGGTPTRRLPVNAGGNVVSSDQRVKNIALPWMELA